MVGLKCGKLDANFHSESFSLTKFTLHCASPDLFSDAKYDNLKIDLFLGINTQTTKLSSFISLVLPLLPRYEQLISLTTLIAVHLHRETRESTLYRSNG